MTSLKTVRAPDLGTDSAEVIEILVQPGQRISVDTPLVSLESAKASMEVPSPLAGVVREILVSLGTKISEGTALIRVEVEGDKHEPIFMPAPDLEPTQPVAAAPVAASMPVTASAPAPIQTASQIVAAPDIGTDSADVIELLVKAGQHVEIDTPLVLLESAKASMEVPNTLTGVIEEVLVKVGDKVSQGSPLVRVAGSAVAISKDDGRGDFNHQPVVAETNTAAKQPALASTPSTVDKPTPAEAPVQQGLVHCGPAVRRLARELGVDLHKVQGSGPKERILKEDVHAFVKQTLTAPPPAPVAAPATTGSGLPPLPTIDFSKWGEIEYKDLTKIQKLSAQNLHRAWVHIPHVTQFDEADITDLEAFRVAQKDAMKAQGVSLTMLAFLVKACAYILPQFPKFNASLSQSGEQLILKKYVHIGVAVDTPNGLVVPVIRDADKKTISAIAKELGELSGKARDKKLSPAEMQGATFSISSLGGIGGTAFTPIVNWPEVAILGVSRSSQKPVWNGQTFVPRLMLPLSLSYDHRVVDGADGARFITALGQVLADIRKVLL